MATATRRPTCSTSICGSSTVSGARDGNGKDMDAECRWHARQTRCHSVRAEPMPRRASRRRSPCARRRPGRHAALRSGTAAGWGSRSKECSATAAGLPCDGRGARRIWRHAGEHRGGGIGAEDWVFGRLRLVAQAFQAAQPSARHLRAGAGVRTRAPGLAPARPSPCPRPRPPPPDEGIETRLGPALANARIRRPSAPVQSRPMASLREIEEPAPRARLAADSCSMLGAGAIGFAASFLALYWLTAEPRTTPTQDASPPAVPTRPHRRHLARRRPSGAGHATCSAHRWRRRGRR